jgi:aspartyl/asparaginyl-tRNA synthetase
MAEVNPRAFDFTVSKLRGFFKSKGFIECHPQSQLSILAACEDPKTVATFRYAAIGEQPQLYPLPQTNQMHLEHILMRDPSAPGYFCVSTSYRNEPNPVAGRHERIFPMFEFELHGTMDDLRLIEHQLLQHLGFNAAQFRFGDYCKVAAALQTHELDHGHEAELCADAPVFFLENFPEYTSPFWNMLREDGVARKIDVLLCGMETIGSAVRSCDKADMRRRFLEISDGGYAKLLYDLFGKERVDAELEIFFNLTFIPRAGGGIGLTRLIRAMELEGLFPWQTPRE